MPEPEQDLEIARILCVQIVKFSSLPINEQTTGLPDRAAMMNGASAIQTARRNQQLMGMASDDGMSLAFFGNPETPLRSGIAITAAAKQMPHLRLRMGIHSSPVFRMCDLQGKENVAAGGMTAAQRVIECGDAGRGPVRLGVH